MTNPNNTTRPAWVEVDLRQLRRNFEIFLADKPKALGFIHVVKDQAYGHGMIEVARIGLEFGASHLAVATVDEAMQLREVGIEAPILIFGERAESELSLCVEHDFTCFVNEIAKAEFLHKLAEKAGKIVSVHSEIDSGLSRYGVRWNQAIPVIKRLHELKSLRLEGIMSHFAMSDELDKTFAMLQLSRFQALLSDLQAADLKPPLKHMCNTGGFLDLPPAHFDCVRIGILPLGVYPSQVCRRIPGLQPIMTVKTRIASLRDLEIGDYVGYGMRYRAEGKRRIAVLPIGYGDGYPRVRNAGEVLVHGKRAPIVGGNAMDAMMVDVTDIAQAQVWDEVVLMGKQGDAEIDVHAVARLSNTVSYDVLTGWRARLPRIYMDKTP